MTRYLSATALGLLLAMSIWLMGFIWFLTLMPTPNRMQITVPTDAIAVWTGGAGRAEKGIDLLRKQQGRWLLLSGVHEKANKTEIFSDFRRRNPKDWARVQSHIILGHQAKDTRGNAAETAEWVQRNQFVSLRLVTANYHMPRSMIEMERRMPNFTLVPSPVFTEHFLYGNWWQDKKSALLVLSEYHKTIASVVYGWVSGG